MDAQDLSFGVVADVQHADIDDGWDFHKTRQRRYRGAVPALRRACEAFKASDVAFVAQLGDLLDGKGKETAHATLRDVVLPCFSNNGFVAGSSHEQSDAAGGARDVHHLIGNHELYCFTRDELHQLLVTGRGGSKEDSKDSKPARTHYYAFAPRAGWRFVVLDPYEFSSLNGDREQVAEAVKMMREHNPNDVCAAVDWTAGLEGTKRRWLPYNGGVSDAQLRWLRTELLRAREVGERVIVLSHVCVCPGATANETLLWNYDKVLAELHAPESTVIACLYGHDHKGGYYLDEAGIHHKTFEAVLETQDRAHAILTCTSERIVVDGAGDVASAVWELRAI